MNASKNIRINPDISNHQPVIFTEDGDGCFTIPFFAAKELVSEKKTRINAQLKAMAFCAEFVKNPLVLPELAFSNKHRTMRVEMRCAVSKVMQSMIYLTNFKIYSIGTPDLKKGFIPVSMDRIMAMTGLSKAVFFRCIAVLKKTKFLISDQRVIGTNGKEIKRRDKSTKSGYAFTDKIVSGLIAALCRFDDNFNRQINKHLPEFFAKKDRDAATKANVPYAEYIKRAYAKLKATVKNTVSSKKSEPTQTDAPKAVSAAQQTPFAMPQTINHDPYLLTFARALITKGQRKAIQITESQAVAILKMFGNSHWQKLLTDDVPLETLLLEI